MDALFLIDQNNFHGAGNFFWQNHEIYQFIVINQNISMGLVQVFWNCCETYQLIFKFIMKI